MSKLQTVVSVEIKTFTRERIEKSKTSTRKDGVSRTQELVRRYTITSPVALLACGHERWNSGSVGTDVRAAVRLACWECERLEHAAEEQRQRA